MNLGVGGDLSRAAEAYCLAAMPETGDDLGEELVGLRLTIDRLEVRFSQLSARHAASGDWEEEGFVSPIHWLRNACHMGSGQAADRLHVGLQMESLPKSTAALLAGQIGF